MQSQILCVKPWSKKWAPLRQPQCRKEVPGVLAGEPGLTSWPGLGMSEGAGCQHAPSIAHVLSEEGRCYPLLTIVQCWDQDSVLPDLLICKVLIFMEKLVFKLLISLL